MGNKTSKTSRSIVALELIARYICRIIDVKIMLPNKRSDKYVQILFMHCARIYSERARYIELLYAMGETRLPISIRELRLAYFHTIENERKRQSIIYEYEQNQRLMFVSGVISTFIFSSFGGIIYRSIKDCTKYADNDELEIPVIIAASIVSRVIVKETDILTVNESINRSVIVVIGTYTCFCIGRIIATICRR